MPPKSTKRKAAGDANGTAIAALTPPDRNTWPGWVEVESEPANFNILLRDMGVRGVIIRELESIEPEYMYSLPQPIHGLIFLFQYNDTDQVTEENGEHVDGIWFANQVPEYACATIALLNIVNNIPGLELGKELQDFKDFTADMDPLLRGDTIDSFDFVKRIHNSLARENEMLNADMVTKGKIDKRKKEQSAAKARATREANKAAKASLEDKAANVAKLKAKGTGGARQPAARKSKRVVSIVSDPSSSEGEAGDGYKPKTKDNANEVLEASTPPRRSERVRKPVARRVVTAADYEEPDKGYHYAAYVPIGDHVWKLDGMNHYPQDLGTFSVGRNGADGGSGDWLDVVLPKLRDRMDQYADINFTLMAVVRDPYATERNALLLNVKKLQAIDLKLDSLGADWRDLEGGETRKEVVTGISAEFDISQKDIDNAQLPNSVAEFISKEDDLLGLIKYRQGVLSQQTMLRSGVRDAGLGLKQEEEDATLRKHDFGPFVREWLSALAEGSVLADVLD